MSRFHPTMVLAQREFSPSFSARASFHPTMVLAQQIAGTENVADATMFPSHYGSRSTAIHCHTPSSQSGFPSHYGSRSTKKADPSIRLIIAFPSHYGSRSTIQICVLYAILSTVSIPLWFSLNYDLLFFWSQARKVSIPLWFSLNLFDNYKIIELLVRFHPTMVLAQLKPERIIELLTSRFPSHYGSRSTRSNRE